jgi:hypothetical protein
VDRYWPEIPDNDNDESGMHAHKHMIEASRPNLCDARLIHSIIFNVLFIVAGNVSIVWERFLLQDYAIEHRFVSGEKHREVNAARVNCTVQQTVQ